MTRLSGLLSAGLVDAGSASLATFAVSLYAARALEPATLGAYGLFFPAFVLVGMVPTQLLFLPAEIACLSFEGSDRFAVLRRSFRVGGPVAVAAGVCLGAVVWFVPPEVDRSAVAALALTAAAASVVHPMQDHLRRLLHFGRSSWNAAATSGVQLATTGLALALLHATVSEAWVPFGALALANGVSLLVGWLRASPPPRPRTEALALAPMLRNGRWLLVAGLAPGASQFAVAALIAWLAGAAALGHAEAARVVAQPVFVLGMGLQSVLGPRLMEAAADRNVKPARQTSRTFVLVLLAAGGVYLLLAGPVWPVNPMRWLVPTAYAVPWLVAATIAAHAAFAVSLPFEAQLKGGRRERSLALRELATSALKLAGGATAAATGAFARPLGIGAWGAGRLVTLRAAAQAHYADPPVADDETTARPTQTTREREPEWTS